MAKKVEITIEEKLRALFDLQLIDSRIDEIRNIRGELPLEVEDLENEIEQLTIDFSEEGSSLFLRLRWDKTGLLIPIK